MIQVNRIYLIFNRLVTKKFLVDTSVLQLHMNRKRCCKNTNNPDEADAFTSIKNVLIIV